MQRILGVIFLLACLYSCNQIETSNPEGWKLIYEHDGQGKAIQGSKETLKKAIQSGCDIRIGWYIGPSDDRIIEHVTDAAFLSIYEGEIFAQTRPIMQQIPEMDQAIINLDTLDNRHWYAIIGTTGEMRYTFSGSKKNGIGRGMTQWYINKNAYNAAEN